ncbi:hypothetical protein SeMB42_g01036 [Synchytrium endobioticum]|uniref:Costars domain-containing protein n=1 Tax=Synchytrium endobioticum TaxID=286115 RepID=A0A507DN06_9FUNG|nr:hypothetical protein SeLEV6574_g00494 [Synchytrium endobioticum]TPX53054.1 hypothetical protein SeMB42_g01036 [Synchytrium endobioticum]
MSPTVDEECRLLVQEIKRLGKSDPKHDGKTTIKFGELVMDGRVSNVFEALNGTLRAAKKRKLIDFQGEMLLQGAHNNVDIVLLAP